MEQLYKYLQNKEKIILSTEIARGGEGVVYRTALPAGMAVKLYHQSRKDREKKLRALLRKQLSDTLEGCLIAAVPKELVYDESGNFAGYLMPMISSRIDLNDFRQEGLRKIYFPGSDWRDLLTLSYNLAECVDHMHQSGIVLGDVNPHNFLVRSDLTLCLVDVDSYGVSDPDTGEYFPCTVGMGSLLAPELQEINLKNNARFTRESDCFSLAVMIFLMLMGCHPFLCAEVTPTAEGICVTKEIKQGNSAYFRQVENRRVPSYAPSLEILTPRVRELFARAFTYTSEDLTDKIRNRPTAREWMDAILDMAEQPYKKCRENPEHFYPNTMHECPFCKMEKQLEPTDSMKSVSEPPLFSIGFSTQLVSLSL